jgi:long-chain fatty acid transport protein
MEQLGITHSLDWPPLALPGHRICSRFRLSGSVGLGTTDNYINNHMKKLVSSFWVVACLASTTLSVIATGIDVPDQDAFAVARGMAFVATADNPSAIYYNPAGITQLEGHNIRGGVYGVYLDPTFQSNFGSTFHNQESLHFIPQLFYAYSPESFPLSFGLGLYSPFGLSSGWPQDTGFRTIASKGSISTWTINPVVAWRVTTNFSVAAGLTVGYANVDLQQGLVWPAYSFDMFRVKGEGWDVGYNLGLLWKPIEQISLGISFRSPASAHLQGSTEYYNSVSLPLPGGGSVPAFPSQHVSSSANFPFPLKALCGLSYRPTPKWNIEFDADFTDWNSYNTVTIEQARPFPPLLPKNVPMILNWQSSWYYELGVTRYLGKGWSVSAGYIYNQNSVPDAHYNPLVADLDRQFVSIGTGRKGKHFDFDIAYQFGYGPGRTVTGSYPSATGQSADGKYGFISNAIAVSLGWHF